MTGLGTRLGTGFRLSARVRGKMVMVMVMVRVRVGVKGSG